MFLVKDALIFKGFFGAVFGLVKGIVGAVVGLAKAILRNKVLRMIATVAIAFIPGGSFGIAALKGFGMGFVSSGGDLRYAIIGAVTGAALHGVGNYFTAGGKTLSLGQHIQKGVAQGMIGGAAHKVSGGRFFAGFLSAGASSAFASSGMYDSGIGAAVAGGTTAVLGGGKFANGAATGAFAYTVGQVARSGGRQATAAQEGDINTTVELRHNRIIPWLGPLSPTHAYVIVTDHVTGVQTFFRSGPEGNLFDGGFGPILAKTGEYLLGSTSDYTTTPASSLTVLETSVSADVYINQLQNFAAGINAASISYNPLFSNSNSFAYQAVESLGISRPSTQGFAPASQSILEF